MKYQILFCLVAIGLMVGAVSADTLIQYQGTDGNQTSLLRSQSQGTWNSIITGAGTGVSLDSYVNYVWSRAGQTTDKWDYVMRTGESYNTSSIPDTATINSAVLSQTFYSSVNGTSSYHSGTTVTNFTPTNPVIHVASDYNKFDNNIISSYLLTNYPATYPATYSYPMINFTFASPDAIINKTGYTSIMLRSVNDTLNTIPLWGNSNITYERWIGGQYATYKPFLTIVYTNASSPPVASFTIPKTFLRIPNSVTVTDTSTNTPTSWQWSWGDGSSNSTTQNPTHQYLKRGKWDIILTATNVGGSGTTAATSVRVAGYENYT